MEDVAKASLFRESIRVAWQCGDRVVVVGGPFAGLYGRLEELDFDLWLADVTLLATGINTRQQISLDSIRRHFRNGDHVLAAASPNVGRHGLVVAIDFSNIIFVEDKTRDEVTISHAFLKSYSPDLVLAPPTSSPPTAQEKIHHGQDPLISKRVVIIKGAYKGWRGEISAVGPLVQVVIGFPPQQRQYKKSDIALM
jgi:transcription elongation factor